MDNDKNLSAALCLLEYYLASGVNPVEQIQGVMQKQPTDSLLTTFLYCLNSPKSKEEAEFKVTVFDSLISLNHEYGYLMNIFAANYVSPISNSKAEKYFYQALSKQPKVTGAWHDLGNAFASAYLFDDAWKSYEIMLYLNSEHPMAQKIIALKKELMEAYPDYF